MRAIAAGAAERHAPAMPLARGHPQVLAADRQPFDPGLQILPCSSPGKMVRLRDRCSDQESKSTFVAMVPEPSPSNLPSGGHVLPGMVSDSASSTTSRRLGRFALISALLAVGIWIIWDFLPALLWAVVVAIAIWPLFERSRLRRWNKTAAAAEATLLIGVVVIVPLIVLGVEIGREAVATVQGIREAERLGIPSPEWLARLPLIGSYISDWWQSNLSEPQAAANLLGRIDRNWLIEWTRILGFQLIHRLTILIFTFLTLFFLFRDMAYAMVADGGGRRSLFRRDRNPARAPGAHGGARHGERPGAGRFRGRPPARRRLCVLRIAASRVAGRFDGCSRHRAVRRAASIFGLGALVLFSESPDRGRGRLAGVPDRSWCSWRIISCARS